VNDRVARWVRLGLVAGIVGLAVLILVDLRKDTGSGVYLRSAHADIAAAPDFIALSVAADQNSKFYLIDTTKQVICVYQLVGEKIRLVAARDFAQDTDIVDTSGAVGGQPSPEGGNGATVKEAILYRDALKKAIEDAEKKAK
jgi:hypothetical protein